jgi:hypothetical protein
VLVLLQRLEKGVVVVDFGQPPTVALLALLQHDDTRYDERGSTRFEEYFVIA